jgi:hypothetical protein
MLRFFAKFFEFQIFQRKNRGKFIQRKLTRHYFYLNIVLIDYI